MPKKLKAIFLLFALFPFSSLIAAEKQVRVVADKAPIYAENNIHSYKIDTLKKGTILTLFETGQPIKEWFYVRYHSQRWKSVVTGFIQASMIEQILEKPQEEPKAEKIAPKPAEVPKKIEEEKEAREEEPPKISVEEKLVASSILPQKLFTLPESKEREIEPRIFMYLETRPPEPKPAKIKPKPEKMTTQPETKKKEEAAKKKEKPAEKKPEQKQIKTPVKKPEEPPRPKRPKLPSEFSLLTMSVGYGPSLGSGLGGFVQLNTKMGFSLHLGAGYYPTSYFYSDYDWVKNKVLYSAGIKYYLPFKTDRIRTYLDLQYGGVSVEAVQIVTGIWLYQYDYKNIQKTLYGPSILAGIELKLGSIGLNGAIGLSYNTTEWDYWARDYFLTADVGLLIYLW